MVGGGFQVLVRAEPVVVVVAQLDARGAAALRRGARPQLQRARPAPALREQPHLACTPTLAFHRVCHTVTDSKKRSSLPESPGYRNAKKINPTGKNLFSERHISDEDEFDGKSCIIIFFISIKKLLPVAKIELTRTDFMVFDDFKLHYSSSKCFREGSTTFKHYKTLFLFGRVSLHGEIYAG